MCANAQKTLINLMGEIEPSIIALGTELNLTNTPEFQKVIAAYNLALTAVTNWTSGTPAQDAIEVLNDLQAAIGLLPIPTSMQMLLNIILAGVATVIAVLTANSPAPAPIPAVAGADATTEETQAQHQAEVVAVLTAKVKTLVPNFKRSIWHSAGTQYKNTWNSAVDSGRLPVTMKIA